MISLQGELDNIIIFVALRISGNHVVQGAIQHLFYGHGKDDQAVRERYCDYGSRPKPE
jgi:hypothetical protein